MEVLFENANLILICSLLCIGGFFLGIILQVLGGLLGFVFGIVDFLLNIITGGPAAWCGCIVILGGGFLCVVMSITMVNLLSTCGTPEAVNFCRLLGYT